MTAADLRALSAAATPDPWMNDGARPTIVWADGEARTFAVACVAATDAELIVWLRNHADAIADLIDAAEKVVRRDGLRASHPAMPITVKLAVDDLCGVLAALEATP